MKIEEVDAVLKDLKEFGQQCEGSGYTDTGDAWDLLNRMGVILERLASDQGETYWLSTCSYCGWPHAEHKLNNRDEIVCPGERDGTLGEVIDRRVQVYGDPVTGFAAIAEMWTTYLDYPVQAHQVPMMMLLMKVVRSKTSPDYSDHIDDIKGYADIFEKVIGEDMIQARSVNEYIEKKWPGES